MQSVYSARCTQLNCYEADYAHAPHDGSASTEAGCSVSVFRNGTIDTPIHLRSIAAIAIALAQTFLQELDETLRLRRQQTCFGQGVDRRRLGLPVR